MNKKQFVYIFCVTIVVVLAGFLAVRARQKSWQTSAQAVGSMILPDFPANDIVKITIANKDGNATLAKKEGRWGVEDRYGYAADFSKISEFLRDLLELKAAQTLAVGESQYGRLDLLPPEKGANTATVVTFWAEKNRQVAALRLGKEHMSKPRGNASPMMGGGSWPDGRYVLVPETKTVALVSKAFSSVAATATDWLDKEFFKIGDMKSASFKQGDKTLWQVTRETKSDDMKLVGLGKNEEQEKTKVDGIKNAFSYASFADVADPALAAVDIGMDNPKVFAATDFDGFTYEVKVGKETDGKYFVTLAVQYKGQQKREAIKDEKPEDKETKDQEFHAKQLENQKKAADLTKRVKGWIYLVNKSTVDSVLAERKDLAKKKPEKKKDDKKAAAKTDKK